MTMPTFALTAAQFDGLAAGYGSPDAAAILRAGQLTKHKLLLRALLSSVGPSSAVDLLLAAEAAAPETIAELLHHPHLDAWASQALRTGSDTGYLTSSPRRPRWAPGCRS
jgi:HEXXH motif-containing protein